MAAHHTTSPPFPLDRRPTLPLAERRRAQLQSVLHVARSATERAASQEHDADVRQLARQALTRLRLAEALLRPAG